MQNPALNLHPEVQEALENNKPVVALESTIIAHGMPYPKNVETALAVEKSVRKEGAVPATIAILNGQLKAGLTAEEIDYLGKSGQKVAKASRRDIPFLVANQRDGATTVASTMIIAAMAGIRVFATGGIGGVHRRAEKTMDISADLQELAKTDVLVVSAGAKSILDLKLTLEYLETYGVPVVGCGTDEFPAFFTARSGLKVPHRMDTPAEIARLMKTKWTLGLNGGILVANPIPEEYAMAYLPIENTIHEAIAEAEARRVEGKELTPFLLAKIKTLTKGKSLEANIQLVLNNACMAARIAKSYSKL